MGGKRKCAAISGCATNSLVKAGIQGSEVSGINAAPVRWVGNARAGLFKLNSISRWKPFQYDSFP